MSRLVLIVYLFVRLSVVVYLLKSNSQRLKNNSRKQTQKQTQKTIGYIQLKKHRIPKLHGNADDFGDGGIVYPFKITKCGGLNLNSLNYCDVLAKVCKDATIIYISN